MYNAQYRFRNEHSSKFATYELIYRIIQYLEKTNTPISIFLDLSKAFDSLDHAILLDKLQYYGINGLSLKCLTSYLRNTKQNVDIDSKKSEVKNISTGPNTSKLFNFIIFADDTTLEKL